MTHHTSLKGHYGSCIENKLQWVRVKSRDKLGVIAVTQVKDDHSLEQSGSK